MIQVNRIYLIFNRLVTKKFLVDTSEKIYKKNYILILAKVYKPGKENVSSNPCFLNLFLTVERRSSG